MIILGLGTNLGDRQQNLENAIKAIDGILLNNIKRSAILENAPLLPPNPQAEWANKNFLNMAISGTLAKPFEPEEFLQQIKIIERKLGRAESALWAPRIIDIDILTWNNISFQSANLNIPHKGLGSRDFALKPWLELARPALCSTKILGIVNLTPDSFSDGGTIHNQNTAFNLLFDGAHYIDVGAESTRPNATPISLDEEWARLQPFLEATTHMPISLDSKNPETVKKSLKYNSIKILNDVTGFSNPQMLQLAADNDIMVVAMHSLTVPADKNITLNQPPIPTLKNWFADKYSSLTNAGILPKNIIFDVGIGFGKTAAQSIELIENAAELAQFCRNLGCKILYGHSRKSFMNLALPQSDVETARITGYLNAANIDFVRVHNVKLNKGAILL